LQHLDCVDVVPLIRHVSHGDMQMAFSLIQIQFTRVRCVGQVLMLVCSDVRSM